MARVIHTLLDAETEKQLDELQRSFGWSDSQVVREGIKALSVLVVPKSKRKIVGVGRFQSCVQNLGSNKRHLKGFGK